jgi:4-hydroxy-tetrahydrodipicolinate synthase
MIVPPYYLLPPKRLVLEHFRAVKDAVDMPIILYNNPWFAGLELTSWEVAQLAEEGVIAGVKVAHGDAGRVHDLKYLCGDKLAVMYGHDVNALEGLLAGADGWISGLPNLIPGLARQLYEHAVVEKNLQKAQDLWMKLLPLFHFDVVIKHNEEPHWLPGIKDGLNLLGQRVGKPRRPLTPLQPEEYERLRTILANLGLLPQVTTELPLHSKTG